ncbi:MAG TPA: hypothetical protein VIK54_10105, partial [Acidimicrobiia bacterium]
ADGLVERRPDAADRRATIVVTTRAGRTQFRDANAVYVAALRTSFGRHLRAGDHARLAAILSRVTAHREGGRSQVAAAGSLRMRSPKPTSAS